MNGFCETPGGIAGPSFKEAIERLYAYFSDVSRLEKRQDVEAAGGVAVVDLSDGEYIRITPLVNVTSLTLANWKPAPLVNRITIEVNSNNGNYVDLSFARVSDLTGTLAKEPQKITSGIVQLVSTDAGKTCACFVLSR